MSSHHHFPSTSVFIQPDFKNVGLNAECNDLQIIFVEFKFCNIVTTASRLLLLKSK